MTYMHMGNCNRIVFNLESGIYLKMIYNSRTSVCRAKSTDIWILQTLVSTFEVPSIL